MRVIQRGSLSTSESGHSFIAKMQVGNEHLEMGRTLGVQVQEVGDISRKKKVTRDVSSPEPKGLHGMKTMAEVIRTSFEPGVLASVMPEGFRHVNVYLPWRRNGRSQLRESW